jgi:adenine-specific DNA-methyltransferase
MPRTGVSKHGKKNEKRRLTTELHGVLMSTNVSKQKRADLTAKIKKIHKYIAGAKQDENTRNLITWLSEIEKEISTKKFGLVFEEHREAIDQTLETHTPVLTEDKGLFIDNGGQMNFLIEGDNLPALKLLLKTYKGKVDVIYIDRTIQAMILYMKMTSQIR